ncbi:methyltransferase family protein [Thermodesulfobacteriota bacterium]
MTATEQVVRRSVPFLYLFIGLEIIIMISPFAAYFYAVYGPLLDFFYGFKATAWLTGFFLPHAVVSKSPLLNFLNAFGRTIFSLGIIAFLIGAIQIYSAKFRRKPVVTSLLYRWIRHPQYLFLAISGLGLLLFWPRFMILFFYINMLFIYYLLARYEEKRMAQKHGDSYRKYMESTAMFIPWEPGEKIFRALFGWMKPHGLALFVSYGLVLVLAIIVALGLRGYTRSQISTVYLAEKNITAISVLPNSEESLREIVDVALTDSTVNSFLSNYQQEGHKGFLVHIMPQTYMMQGLFVQPFESKMTPGRRLSWRTVVGFVFPFLSSRGHHRMGGMNNGPVRLIFSQLTWADGAYAPANEAWNFMVKHLPILKVDIDFENQKVRTVDRTSKRNFWGQMPMPLF